jgi:hypothetical protein
VWTQNESWRIDRLNDLFREAVEQRPGESHLVDLGGFLCPGDDVCIQRLDDGSEVRYDGLHFSEEGAEVVAGWLAGEIHDTLDG